jgi:clavulanate-9-aldehyde reducatase
MAGELDGKVAAITGASSGIGEATAVALAGAGASVSVAARRKDRLDELAERISSQNGRALAIEADIGDQGEAEAFLSRTAEELGGPDILVNNAGVMLLGPVEGAETEHWRRMVDVNVLGLLYCTHAALPLMRERGGGHIVNVSWVAGRHATLGSAVYNLTKFGVTGFSEALRQEALNSNIRVTVIEPGFVATELQSHNEHPAIREALEKFRGDIGTVLEAEDIASGILYAVAQPAHVNVNEVMIRPTGQRR